VDLDGEHVGFDLDEIDVHFLPDTPSMRNNYKRLESEIEDARLIIVVTSPAFFEGKDENSNTEMIDHAKLWRSFTTFDGGPTVIAACHPTKGASEKSQRVLHERD